MDAAKTIRKPFILTVPHSGEQVPDEASWLLGLEETVLMCDVDRYVDQLYKGIVEELQIPHVYAQWHRYAVDLNRWADDVDQDSVMDSQHPSGSFARGLHWVITTKGQRLMPKPMTRELHDVLVEKYFEPFHVAVRKSFADCKKAGASNVYHLDAHSMPSLGTKEHRDPGQYRSDVVISDCDGQSCSRDFLDLVVESYRSAGLNVAINWPYGGGRVTETYGHPDRGQHSIQVELNRALYMNEENKKLIPEKKNLLEAKIKMAIEKIYSSLPDMPSVPHS